MKITKIIPVLIIGFNIAFSTISKAVNVDKGNNTISVNIVNGSAIYPVKNVSVTGIKTKNASDCSWFTWDTASIPIANIEPNGTVTPKMSFNVGETTSECIQNIQIKIDNLSNNTSNKLTTIDMPIELKTITACSEVMLAPNGTCDTNKSESIKVDCVRDCKRSIENIIPTNTYTGIDIKNIVFDGDKSDLLDVSPLTGVGSVVDGNIRPGDRVYLRPTMSITPGNVALTKITGTLTTSNECVTITKNGENDKEMEFEIPDWKPDSENTIKAMDFFEFKIDSNCKINSDKLVFTLNLKAEPEDISHPLNFNIYLVPRNTTIISACDGQVEGSLDCSKMPDAPYGKFEANGKWNFTLKASMLETGSMPYKTLLPCSKFYSGLDRGDKAYYTSTCFDDLKLYWTSLFLDKADDQLMNLFEFSRKDYPTWPKVPDDTSKDVFDPTLLESTGGVHNQIRGYDAVVMKTTGSKFLSRIFCLTYKDEPLNPERCEVNNRLLAQYLPLEMNAGVGFYLIGQLHRPKDLKHQLNDAYLDLTKETAKDTLRELELFYGNNMFGTPFIDWEGKNFKIKDLIVSCKLPSTVPTYWNNYYTDATIKEAETKGWIDNNKNKSDGVFSPIYVRMYGNLEGNPLNPQANYSTVQTKYDDTLIPFVNYNIDLTEDYKKLNMRSCYLIFDKKKVSPRVAGRISDPEQRNPPKEDNFIDLYKMSVTMKTADGEETGDFLNVFGIAKDATDEIDNKYDGFDRVNSEELISNSQVKVDLKNIALYFTHQKTDPTNNETILSKLAADIKADFLPTEYSKKWEFFITQSEANANVTLVWEAKKQFSDDYTVTLVDNENNNSVDMKTISKYTYTAATQTRSFSIVVAHSKPMPPTMTSAIGRNKNVEIEWIPPEEYMNGKPIEKIKGYDVYKLFPGLTQYVKLNRDLIKPEFLSFNDSLFNYNGQNYSYKVVAWASDTFPNSSDFSASVVVTPRLGTPLTLNPGWNLVGISRYLGTKQADQEIYQNARMSFNSRNAFRMETNNDVSMYSMWTPLPIGFEPQFEGQCVLDNTKPGSAFWIYNDSTIDTVNTIYGSETDINVNYVIELEKGWNMVGNPYTSEQLSWDKIRYATKGQISFPGAGDTLTQALALGHIEGPYWYDTDTKTYKLFTETDEWQPWQGLFIKSYEHAVIKFNVCETGTTCTIEIISFRPRKCNPPSQQPPSMKTLPLAKLASRSNLNSNHITDSTVISLF